MSNRFSKKLGEIYKEDRLLRVFPVPNGYIKGVTVELKADIQGIGIVTDSPEAVLEHAQGVFKRHVEELLEPVLADVSTALRENRNRFSSEEKAERMAEALDQAAWRASVAEEVLEVVLPQMDSMVSPKGVLNEEATAEILADAVGKAAVDHPDYAPLPHDVRKVLHDHVREKTADPERMGRLRSRLANRPVCTQPSVRVTTANANLSSLGPELVGKLELQAAIRDYIVQAENSPVEGSGVPPPTTVKRLVPAKH
jgi:hypothetical protein